MRETESRDDVWLTSVVDAHYDQVVRYAARRLPLDATTSPDDVAAEVFAAAWKKRAAVPTPELPWLYAAASNVVAQATRSWGRRLRLFDRAAARFDGHAPSADAQVDTWASQGVVLNAIARLSDTDAEVVRLWAWEELDHHGIATVLSCTPATARKRLQRARERLRDHLVAAGIRDLTCDDAVPSAQAAWSVR